MEVLIKYISIPISLIALSVAGLNYFFNHHHKPKKLFLVPMLDLESHNQQKVDFYIVNGAKDDVIILSIELHMRGTLLKNCSSYARGPGTYVKPKNMDSSIKSGESKLYTAYFEKELSELDIKQNGTFNGDETKVDYFLFVSWCNSSGERYRVKHHLFTIGVDKDNQFNSLNVDDKKKVNLYLEKSI